MNIFIVLQVTALFLGLISAIIYLLPIIFVTRLHKTNNIYTVNLCLAILFCGFYWLALLVLVGYYIAAVYNVRICTLMDYLQMCSTIQIPLAMIGISTNRLCTIVYPRKVLFKKKIFMIIGISIQWISGFILSLPRIVANPHSCATRKWRGIYALVMITVIPSVAYVIINLIIFKYVRSATNRVHSINEQDQPINRRDLHLLRHLIVMFCIFIGGWSPIYTYIAIVSYVEFTSISFSVLFLLAVFSVLCVILDLFLYNHEWRKYLQEKICQRQ